MEIRRINLDDRVIEYQLNTKRIKRCYLKVIAGKVVVNSSPAFTINTIEQLIRDNKEVLLKQIDKYQPKYNYINNGFVYIFDKRYNIVLKDMKMNKIGIHDNQIYVYNKNIQIIMEKELKKILINYLEERIEYYRRSYFNLKMPKIEIKKLKSRWGACYSKMNKVSFNLVLVHLDKTLIDYVIIHELCHFLQPNHSKMFYDEIEKRMPDYKLREKTLKEIGI